MVFINLIGGTSLKIKTSEYDFILEFNEALREKKAIKVKTLDSAMYVNPRNIIIFGELIEE